MRSSQKPINPNPTKLFLWNWTGGGYNSCRARTREEAIEKAKAMCSLVPRLDTLVMATPIYDPEQSWGRILREHPEKKPPIIVDLRDDSIAMYRRWGENRDTYYEKVRGA